MKAEHGVDKVYEFIKNVIGKALALYYLDWMSYRAMLYPLAEH